MEFASSTVPQHPDRRARVEEVGCRDGNAVANNGDTELSDAVASHHEQQHGGDRLCGELSAADRGDCREDRARRTSA